MAYLPKPIETKDIELSPEILEIAEALAEQIHETWAEARMREGWTWGPVRDDAKKQTPCLVPYAELPECEKEYDRITSQQTLKFLLKKGYRIER